MHSRAEITGEFAYAYSKASKNEKGQILDAVVEVTGWCDELRRNLKPKKPDITKGVRLKAVA